MKKLSLLAALLTATATLSAASIDVLADKQVSLSDIESLTPPTAAAIQTPGSRRAHKTFVTPEGTPLDYKMKYNVGTRVYPDRPVQVSFSEDGQSVYFGNLFPSFLTNDMGAWTKGDIQPDSTIIVKMQPIIDYDVNGDESSFYTLYAGGYDAAGGVMTDAVFVLHADGSVTQQDPNAYIALGAYIGETYAGLITYANNSEMTPLTEVLEPVTIPATAICGEAIYDGRDLSNQPLIRKRDIATDGNDVYFKGFTPDIDAWVKGTREGSTVTIKSGQYLGIAQGYLLQLGLICARADFSSYEFVDEVTLSYDPETGIYAQVRESETDDHYMFVEQTLSGTIFSYTFDFTIKPYDGPKASIPEDPYNLTFYDFWESSQKYAIMFSNTAYGTDGTYLEPENRFYYIYIDDEILTFDTDTYTELPEEMTLIPWNFTASNNDIYSSSNYHYAYIYESLFEQLGVQFLYFFNGLAYYSNIVYIDPEGNVTTVEVEQPNAIANAGEAKVTGMEYFNAAGQRQNFQQKGFNLVRVTLSDGTQKTYKMYVK